MKPWLSRIARLAPAKEVDAILGGGCQGFILIPADQYAEFLRGTRLAAYLGMGLGMIYGLVFVLFLND